ncbi:hypothetical protein OJAV_G00071310 [Oryzias javanicus]|uniref:cAMP-dependent protein kinase inhibitor n=1 Tax=Oryzias javanicus TaxID=123683 RepID=A0A437D961_ORYJA|nr:hypothetical protein OJAV_G00071310 [Oryzias javanicus]
MMDVETSYSDFINCDRTGRRNAVPDISGEEKSAPSTSELSKDMAEMDLKAGEGNPGPSPPQRKAPSAKTRREGEARPKRQPHPDGGGSNMRRRSRRK